ncbi:MAG: VWA domain-containing protein [Spirochaetes bacterium]|nr:MAG: VWA domain-containing protein [Spirochaetota bacterium]
MKTAKWKGIVGVILLLCSLAAAGEVSAKERKDVILVLDTSLSMVGQGGNNIMPMVKKSLEEFIGQLNEGDSLTFVTFDSEVKTWPTVSLQSKDAKDILKKYITMVEAKGQWTYTQAMLVSVFKTARELEEKDKSRNTVIVVLTDGVDDPPPGFRGDTLTIKDVGATDKDWFIYLVNLGELKNNPKFAKLQQDIGGNTTVVDASGEVQKALEKDLMKDMDKAVEARRSFWQSPLFYALIGLVVLLAAFLTYRRMSGVKVTGHLEYWDHTMMDPYVKSFDITRHAAKVILVGKGHGIALTIHELQVHDPFKLFAKRDKNAIHVYAEAGKDAELARVKGEPGSPLNDGDVFKVANYSFRYTVS